MKAYAYRALFEPGDRRGNIVVTFPDVPEVITQGRGKADAQSSAEEALGLALLSYPARGLPLPKARASGKKLVAVASLHAFATLSSSFSATISTSSPTWTKA